MEGAGKRMKSIVTEAQVQSAVIQWLKLHGIPCVRTNSGLAFYEGKDGKRRAMRGLPKGTADIHGIVTVKRSFWGFCDDGSENWLPEKVKGILLAIEVKRPGQEPRFEQQAYLDMINAQGGVGIWVNSIEMLENKLRNAGVML
jgi:hypothetical protein